MFAENFKMFHEGVIEIQWTPHVTPSRTIQEYFFKITLAVAKHSCRHLRGLISHVFHQIRPTFK